MATTATLNSSASCLSAWTTSVTRSSSGALAAVKRIDLLEIVDEEHEWLAALLAVAGYQRLKGAKVILSGRIGDEVEAIA